MKFIISFQKSAILTYASIASAVVGISFIENATIAIFCLFLCALLDIFDGRFARLFRQRSNLEKRFGIAIDSLADTLAFVALPIVFFVTLSDASLVVTIAVFYAFTGITRLAVFTAEATPGKVVTHYRGLPITLAGIFIPIAYLAESQASKPLLILVMSVVYIVLAFLFIVDIRVKKP